MSPESIPDIVSRVARPLGATDVVVYLVDFAGTTLEPIPDRAAHAEEPEQESVLGSMAGRAFVEGPARPQSDPTVLACGRPSSKARSAPGCSR